MKRLFLSILTAVLIPSLAWAAGTVTVTNQRQNPYDVSYTVVFSWTADSSDGSVPTATAYFPYGAYITKVVTNPGATAPTDNYDITLTDIDGNDVMGGSLANRDTANTEQAVPTVHSDGTNTIFGAAHVLGAITLNITNNSVNSATGTVRVYVIRAE